MSPIYAPASLQTRPMSNLRVLCFLLLAICITATGCASKYGAQQTTVAYYPDCYEPIAEMRKSEYGVAKGTAGGALLGALVGAVGGYLATGKAGGAIVGGAAGAVVGGAIGYDVAARSQKREDAARFEEYASRLDKDSLAFDKATAGANVARQCYQRQFDVAVKEYKQKHLTKPQFQERYTEIASGMEEAAYILGEQNKYAQAVATEYRQILTEETERLGLPHASVPKKKTAAKPKAAKKPTETANKTEPAPTSPDYKPTVTQKEASRYLKTDDGKKLTDLATKTGDLETKVEASAEEERLMRERLSAMNQAAEDIMS